MGSRIGRDPGGKMDEEQANYRSFLLRLWWANDEGTVVLRIYIENPITGERKGFASLDDLTTFLGEEVGLNLV